MSSLSCTWDVHYAVAALRESLLFLHLLVAEDVLFEGFGHLLGHLPGAVAGRHGHHHALPYGEVGEFVLAHLRQAVDAEGHEAARQQYYDLPVVHGPFNEITLFVFHHALLFVVEWCSCQIVLTFVPLHTFWLPSTMTRSPAFSPDVTVTPSPTYSPQLMSRRAALPSLTTHTNVLLRSSIYTIPAGTTG
jgi:hypothetical protein